MSSVADSAAKWSGIDHGTGNSAIVCEGQVIQYAHGRPTVASVVRYCNGQFSVADGPAEDGEVDLKSFKRVLGRSKLDNRLQTDLDIVPYARRDPAGDGVVLQIGDNSFYPEEIGAFLIGSLFQEARLKFPACRNAVIAVPAHFNKTQILATHDAALMAGAENVKTIPEPVAVVLHLLNTTSCSSARFILVVDGGAGTWDLSAVTIGKAGPNRRFTVKATAGDNALGGLDVDKALQGIVLAKVEGAVPSQSLLEKCEKAKIHMSKQPLLESIIQVTREDRTKVAVTVTRADFNKACREIQVGIACLFDEIFQKDPTMKERIDTIALNGGSSSLPCVRAICEDYLPGKTIIQQEGDVAVAFGASLFGSDPSIQVMDVLPQSIGVLAYDPEIDEKLVEPILTRNTQLPAKGQTTLFVRHDHPESMGFKLYEGESMDPDDCALVGRFRVQGTSSATAGTEILVTIDVDMQNVVHARAVIQGVEGDKVIDCAPKFRREEFAELQQKTQTRLAGGVAPGRVLVNGGPAGSKQRKRTREDQTREDQTREDQTRDAEGIEIDSGKKVKLDS